MGMLRGRRMGREVTAPFTPVVVYTPEPLPPPPPPLLKSTQPEQQQRNPQPKHTPTILCFCVDTSFLHAPPFISSSSSLAGMWYHHLSPFCFLSFCLINVHIHNHTYTPQRWEGWERRRIWGIGKGISGHFWVGSAHNGFFGLDFFLFVLFWANGHAWAGQGGIGSGALIIGWLVGR